MKKLLLFCTSLITAFSASGQDGGTILQKTIQAYGGDSWNKVNYIQMHHVDHTQWLEQSENPNGPFIVSYLNVEEMRAINGCKLNQKIETRFFQSKLPSTVTYVLNDSLGYMAMGERKGGMPYNYIQENKNWVSYAPEQVLREARKSKVNLDKSVILEGVPHYQLSFKSRGVQYRLLINSHTYLMSEAHVDTYLPYEFFFSLWGKFTTRIQYTLYALYQKNIIYPLQWDIYRAGNLWKKITINDIQFLETADESPFTIPEEITKAPVRKQNVNDVRLPTDQAIEVAKGIFVIPGNWFTGWVEQEDGILVIEAPISSGYSVQLIDEVKKRYPSKKINGVVVSSDAWPHIAGVREYFAMKIPVYTNILNKEILDKVAVVDHSPAPDHQQINEITPTYILIDKPLLLNDKNMPVQIIPVNGEGGERMVAVYFPKQKVLYASDLVQQLGDQSFFFIEYLAEVKAVVDRNHLDVETVYAMHTKPLAWKEIENALEKNK